MSVSICLRVWAEAFVGPARVLEQANEGIRAGLQRLESAREARRRDRRLADIHLHQVNLVADAEEQAAARRTRAAIYLSIDRSIDR